MVKGLQIPPLKMSKNSEGGSVEIPSDMNIKHNRKVSGLNTQFGHPHICPVVFQHIFFSVTFNTASIFFVFSNTSLHVFVNGCMCLSKKSQIKIILSCMCLFTFTINVAEQSAHALCITVCLSKKVAN